MRASNELVLRIAPELGRITVEERKDNVISCKEITPDALRGCIRDSMVHHGYESGFLPPHCLSADLTEKGASVVVWYPKTHADISFYETPYPDFPIPRLVFAYHRSNEGKISGCRIGVVEDETPRPTTPMYHYPFSNVSNYSGILCIGANQLPTYKTLMKTVTLPGLLLSIPNNLHEFNRGHNRLDLEYRDLLEHLKDKTPDYYYEHVLIRNGKTLRDFIGTKESEE